MCGYESIFIFSAMRKARIGCILGLIVVWQAYQSPVMGQFGSTVQHFPQVVLNQGSTTSFTIHNPSSAETISVDIRIYSPEAGIEMDSEQVDLGPGTTQTVSFGDPNANLTTGSAQLSSEHEFIATEFFSLFVGGMKPRVGVLHSPPSGEIRFLGFVNQQVRSGLAIHNPSPDRTAEITLRVKEGEGQHPVGEKMLELQPRQSVAAYLNESVFFGPALTSFEGAVEISSVSSPVSVISLIQEASGDVTTVAVEVASHISTTALNTAVGQRALVSNTTGTNNTGLGVNALFGNTTGKFNVGIGPSALLRNTEGEGNVAVGSAALFRNAEGLFNTAVGYDALEGTTTGSNNIAIGADAGIDLVSGSGNIYIGNMGAEESNTIRIGDSRQTSAFIAGVQVVPPSSRRFKQDIDDMDRASSDLMRLRPVTFRYKKEYDNGEGELQYGLIAEEVAEVYPELVVKTENGKAKTVEYQKITTMLLNELQKQEERLLRLEEALAAQSQQEREE